MDTFDDGAVGIAAPAKRSWRRHSPEFKTRVIALARQPGASMAAVALANGLNANMLRRWVHEAAAKSAVEARSPSAVSPALSFVQLPVPAHRSAPAEPTPPQSDDPPKVAVEIHRAATTVHVRLQMDARSAAWLREVLG